MSDSDISVIQNLVNGSAFSLPNIVFTACGELDNFFTLIETGCILE